MYDNPVGYSKGKRGSPWLVRVRINRKKIIMVLLKVIMKDFDDFFWIWLQGSRSLFGLLCLKEGFL